MLYSFSIRYQVPYYNGNGEKNSWYFDEDFLFFEAEYYAEAIQFALNYISEHKEDIIDYMEDSPNELFYGFAIMEIDKDNKEWSEQEVLIAIYYPLDNNFDNLIPLDEWAEIMYERDCKDDEID